MNNLNPLYYLVEDTKMTTLSKLSKNAKYKLLDRLASKASNVKVVGDELVGAKVANRSGKMAIRLADHILGK